MAQCKDPFQRSDLAKIHCYVCGAQGKGVGEWGVGGGVLGTGVLGTGITLHSVHCTSFTFSGVRFPVSGVGFTPCSWCFKSLRGTVLPFYRSTVLPFYRSTVLPFYRVRLNVLRLMVNDL